VIGVSQFCFLVTCKGLKSEGFQRNFTFFTSFETLLQFFLNFSVRNNETRFIATRQMHNKRGRPKEKRGAVLAALPR
jgi:hypothetical protein